MQMRLHSALPRGARLSQACTPCCRGSPAARRNLPFRKQKRESIRTSAFSEEQSARIAAERAVDAFVRDGSVIGLGHGSIVMYALEIIGNRIKDHLLQDVSCLSSSTMATAEANVQGVPLRDTNDSSLQADVTLIEAGEVDCSGKGLSFITGRAASEGGIQQPQLQSLRDLTERSKQCVALVPDPLMVVRRLGGALPVLVDGADWEATAEELDDLFIGDAEIWRRSRDDAADPRGGKNPFISPEGYSILDIRFLSSLKFIGEAVPYEKIAQEISAVKGVVAHGLMLDVASAAVIASGQEPKIIEKGLLFGFKDERS